MDVFFTAICLLITAFFVQKKIPQIWGIRGKEELQNMFLFSCTFFSLIGTYMKLIFFFVADVATERKEGKRKTKNSDLNKKMR